MRTAARADARPLAACATPPAGRGVCGYTAGEREVEGGRGAGGGGCTQAAHMSTQTRRRRVVACAELSTRR